MLVIHNANQQKGFNHNKKDYRLCIIFQKTDKQDTPNKTSDIQSIPKKRSISAVSPPSVEHNSKKQNMEVSEKKEEGQNLKGCSNEQVSALKELLTLLIDEVKSLKDNMNKNYNKLDEKYVQLESKLDERYTNLEQVLLQHKDENSHELKRKL